MDRPSVPAAAPVRAGQHNDRRAQGHTAAGAGRGARVAHVPSGRGHLDRHLPDRGAGGDRRGAAGRRGHVAVFRVQPRHRVRRVRAGSRARHRSVRGHGPVPEGGRSAPDPDRALHRQPERDQPEHVQDQGARRAQSVRRRAGAHIDIDQRRQGDGGQDPVRGVRLGRHALRRYARSGDVRQRGGPAARGRPVRVRGRAVRKRVRLHADHRFRRRTLLPVRARRR